MRYRKLSPTGDFVFGQGPQEFLVDVPEAVAQAVKTRLLLFQGEWFLNNQEGMPWSASVLGTGTQPIYDQVIKQHVLETQGVTDIPAYESFLNDTTRALAVTMTISTIYGTVPVAAVL